MDNFAPVLIPTLNRHVHFKNCVDSLSRCTHADKTDLYIALDYPLYESHREGYEKIKEYLPNIKGFKSINVIKRKENYGPGINSRHARTHIFKKYDRLIFSEDDNEFSLNFLDYLNKGLNKFFDWHKVYAVCGYNYPIQMPASYRHNYYFHREFSAWGYGTWKHKFIRPEIHPETMKEMIMNKEIIKELKRLSGRHYYNILTAIRMNKTKKGDFAVFLNNLIYDQYCVFPVVSKVRNHGHDGSGVHCGNLSTTPKKNVYVTQQIDLQKDFDFSKQPPLENAEIMSQLKRYFHMSSKAKIKQILYYYVFLILGRKKGREIAKT